MDVINFPDPKNWYEENKAVLNSRDYGNAQFKLHHLDDDHKRIFIKRQEDPSIHKPNLIQILERMNDFYIKNDDRYNESTDWVQHFYEPSNKFGGSSSYQDL